MTASPGLRFSPRRRRSAIAETALLALVSVGVALYAGDWAVFTMRGRPVDSVTVERYLVVPLKGKKTEYDDEGQRNVPCARALFPQGAWSPCWYLRRHPIVADKL